VPCTNKFLRQGYKGGTVTVRGYRQMFVDGRKRYEHALVWEAAYGPRPKGWVMHHLNGERLDNRLRNLLAMPRGMHPRLHHLVAASAFTLRQAAEEARALYGGQEPDPGRSHHGALQEQVAEAWLGWQAEAAERAG